MYEDKLENVPNLFKDWRSERGLKAPRDDNELREFLVLMLKEQLYAFSMKILFYLVLQSIDVEMSAKLKENLADIEPSDPEFFKKTFDMLFQYAIEKTGDFEEVFGSNTVEKLPFVESMLPSLKGLVSYLSQIRWSEINVDIIGRVFEGLIYKERRHLLGQHFTDTKVVDLILTATLREAKKILDPACGSGTFLVRALNYWRVKQPEKSKIYKLVEGLDIDKLASMLSKMNLYIQALEEISMGSEYYPSVHQGDLFKTDNAADFQYVTTNPPYTRQEELSMAFYDRKYKDYLLEAVKGLPDWNKRASIYAYFLVKGGQMLDQGGRLGFVVENSWLNAEYGRVLKQWFLDNFVLEHIIESNVERWFEDAAVITNILIAEKRKNKDYTTNFVYFQKPLSELIGDPPPASDFTANQRYYEAIESLLSRTEQSVPSRKENYAIFEDDETRIVSIRKSLLMKIDSTYGKWGVFRGPKKYLELIVDALQGRNSYLKPMNSVIEIERGITTNANEIFYLPSKHWQYLIEDDKYIFLKGPGYKSLKISKRYLKPLIKPDHIEKSTYEVATRKKRRKANFVIWVDDITKVSDPGMEEYLKWADNFVKEEHETNGKFPTIIKKLGSPKWTKLPDTSKGVVLLRKAPYKNFSIFFNALDDSQIDCELYAGYIQDEYSSINKKVIFSILNSVLTYIGMELFGRANLGEGVLKTEVTDYKVIPIVDPVVVQKKLEETNQLKQFIEMVDKLLALKPVDIENEASRNIRLELDKHVLGLLGFNEKDIANLYKDLIKLVSRRERRATSV